MENYSAAANNRYSEAQILLNHLKYVAAIHLGGVSVECRLKELLVIYHRINNWDEKSKRLKDPRFGSVIARPGHGLLDCLKKMDALYNRAKTDSNFIKHMDRLRFPRGADVDFIELRYFGGELTQQEVDNWRESYRYVWGWINKNRMLIK